MKPSALYRSEFWRVGLMAARCLPAAVFERLAQTVARAYAATNPVRRRIVTGNLLPLVNHDPRRARELTAQLFAQFGRKLADLWRYECGLPVEHLFREWSGWEHFLAAHQKQRGVLLLTPHLGNWEFGAPILARRGVKLIVITLAEPQGRFTRLREASRARWGIETLVVGQSPFAFVDVIRRLEAGQCVALLVDRPPEASATTVEFCGRPFAASIAGAELARASGCVLLPVYLPRTETGYAAHILPEIPYERRALGDRESRRLLTQKIMKAFEPAIRQHADQWYHFVPIWPRPNVAAETAPEPAVSLAAPARSAH